MDRDERVRRGSSFGAVAAAYAEHRPDYPEAAVRWCLAPATPEAAGRDAAGRDAAGRDAAGRDAAGRDAAGRDAAGLRVLDLGAGTGKLTAALARLGADVTAMDPDAGMLAELSSRLPGVRALPGSAEAIPLADGSVDAVICGQAMHWFDLTVAVPQMARVLATGGVLAGMWNCDDDRAQWVAGLHAVANGALSAALSTRRADSIAPDLARTGAGLFTRVERAEFPNGQRRTAASLVDALATHSKLLVMAPAERDRLLAAAGAYLAARPETSQGEFTLPMITVALRAVRR